MNIEINWAELRNKSAIAAMQGLLSNSTRSGNCAEYANAAVEYADALIAELRKEAKEELGQSVTKTGDKEWSKQDELFMQVCKNALAKYQTTDQWDSNIISQWLEEKLKQ